MSHVTRTLSKSRDQRLTCRGWGHIVAASRTDYLSLLLYGRAACLSWQMSLPSSITASETLGIFRRRLTTHLFAVSLSLH